MTLLLPPVPPPTQVAVSRALPSLRGELVSRFESREDLIRALRASCHIPYYLAS